MVRVRIVKSVAYSGEDVKVAEEMDRIARRDGTNYSTLMVELSKKHVLAHAKGNDVVQLTKFAEHPEMIALPTLGEPIRSDISDDELEHVLKAATARIQEARAIAKRRGWWVDERTGQFEERIR